jgi:hypothetical protein
MPSGHLVHKGGDVGILVVIADMGKYLIEVHFFGRLELFSSFTCCLEIGQ